MTVWMVRISSAAHGKNDKYIRDAAFNVALAFQREWRNQMLISSHPSTKCYGDYMQWKLGFFWTIKSVRAVSAPNMKITSKSHLMGPVSILLPMLIAWCFDRADTNSCVPNASLLPHEQHEQRSLFPHDDVQDFYVMISLEGRMSYWMCPKFSSNKWASFSTAGCYD